MAVVTAEKVRQARRVGSTVHLAGVAPVEGVELAEDGADDGRFGHGNSVTEGTVGQPDEQQ